MVKKDKYDSSSSRGAKTKKRFAGMLDVIALAASLIFILAACTTAKTEGGNPSANASSAVTSRKADGAELIDWLYAA